MIVGFNFSNSEPIQISYASFIVTLKVDVGY